LAASDYLNKDVNRAIKQVIKGSNGAITVNGKVFNGAMPPQNLNDQDIADVLLMFIVTGVTTKVRLLPLW